MAANPKANPPLSSRERVLLEFQRTSLALTLGFLESQQRVMMAYLTGSLGNGPFMPSDLGASGQLENQLSQALSNQLLSAHGSGDQHAAMMLAQQQAAMQQQAAIQAQQQQAAMMAHQQAGIQAQQAAMQAQQQQAAIQAQQQQAAMMAQQQAAMQAQQHQQAMLAQQAAAQTQALMQANQLAAAQNQIQPAATQETHSTSSPAQSIAGGSSSPSLTSTNASANSGTDPEQLIAALVDIVSQRTGYPPEMLEPTLDLEADLGIDSIKRVEILNGFRKMLPESSQLSLESGIEQLATVKTLQGIMDWIRTEFSSDKAAVTGTTTADANHTITKNGNGSDPHPAGTNGTNGANGLNGSHGADGQNGITGSNAANGSNGSHGANGQNGMTGSNGSNGAQGSASSQAPTQPGGTVGTATGARLHAARVEQAAANSTLFTITMNSEEDRFLKDHLFDGVPVMPMAMALELMLEAASSVHSKHKVAEVKELEILAGIVFDAKNTDIHVLAETIEETSGTISVKCSVQSSGKIRRTHFRATIVLTPQSVPLSKQSTTSVLPPNFRGVQILEPQSQTELPTAAEVYQNFMFHGPLFQGVAAVSTMGSNGIAGTITPIQLAQLIATPGKTDFQLNPTLLDSSMQLAGIWARQNMDVTVLPAGFKQMKLHGSLTGKNFNSLVMISPQTKGLEIVCDLGIYSEDNELILSIEGLKGIGSKALNRLSSRESEPVA